MASIGYSQIGLLVLGLILYKILLELWRSYQFERFARENGCEKPFNQSGTWPFSIIHGWRGFFAIVQAAQNDQNIIEVGLAPLFEGGEVTQLTNFDGTIGLMTISPEAIQAMLATHFKDFIMGKMRVSQFYPLLGNSIFSSDGKDWEHSRSLFRPQFNREQINDLEETEKAMRQLIDALGSPDPDGSGWTTPTKLLPLLYNFTLDTASAFLFGESVESQAMSNHASSKTPSDTARMEQFPRDFELASAYAMNRIRAQTLYWLIDGFQFRRAIARTRAFTEQFVQRALDPEAQEKNSARKYNLLTALATQTQDRTDLRNQTLAILFAGRDTTSSLLAWSFTRLALHPEIFQTLRRAILADFPDASKPITFTQLKSCRYLQHFFNEILRLHPSVPINNRTAARNTTLPLGSPSSSSRRIAVRKGTTVTYSVYLMHRRKDLWGDDALEFRPERWEEKRKVPAFGYLPFSGGPRICLGQQFALTEASYVVVRLLQEFDAVEPVDAKEMGELRIELGLTMSPKDGVPVRFRKAQRS